MLYSELTELLLKQGSCTDNKYAITQTELADFHNYLLIDSEYLRMFSVIELASEFFSVCPLFSSSFSPNKREELFYAEKNKYFMSAVSSKFVYLLRKSLSVYDTPNMALSMLKSQDVVNLLINRTSSDTTPYNVLCNIIGSAFGLLTTTKRKVKVDDDTYEFYISDADKVAVLPSDIASALQSTSDINSLKYSSSAGITLYDKPIRCMCGHYGITMSDFDLRGCI